MCRSLGIIIGRVVIRFRGSGLEGVWGGGLTARCLSGLRIVRCVISKVWWRVASRRVVAWRIGMVVG